MVVRIRIMKKKKGQGNPPPKTMRRIIGKGQMGPEGKERKDGGRGGKCGRYRHVQGEGEKFSNESVEHCGRYARGCSGPKCRGGQTFEGQVLENGVPGRKRERKSEVKYARTTPGGGGKGERLQMLSG